MYVHYAISLMIISFPHQYECVFVYAYTVYYTACNNVYVESNIFNQKRSYQISKRSTFRPNLDNTQKAMKQYLHEKGRVMDIWLKIRLVVYVLSSYLILPLKSIFLHKSKYWLIFHPS